MANLKWYIVHTYSGFEHKVKSALEERVKAEGRAVFFGQVLVPTEKVIELVKGERKASSRKFYPGYILVQMELNDDTWHLVRHTPKVTGFIGCPGKADSALGCRGRNHYLADAGGRAETSPEIQV